MIGITHRRNTSDRCFVVVAAHSGPYRSCQIASQAAIVSPLGSSGANPPKYFRRIRSDSYWTAISYVGKFFDRDRPSSRQRTLKPPLPAGRFSIDIADTFYCIVSGRCPGLCVESS